MVAGWSGIVWAEREKGVGRSLPRRTSFLLWGVHNPNPLLMGSATNSPSSTQRVDHRHLREKVCLCFRVRQNLGSLHLAFSINHCANHEHQFHHKSHRFKAKGVYGTVLAVSHTEIKRPRAGALVDAKRQVSVKCTAHETEFPVVRGTPASKTKDVETV
jgi:hypothetical protein